MHTDTIEVGETAYLTPTTPGAARECWAQPQVVVVAVDEPYVTVRIPDLKATRPRSVIPPTPQVVDEQTAAWVRDHVLRRRSREERVLAEVCPCQYGPCGHCDAGRHDQCVHRRPGYRVVTPLAYLTDRRGFVVGQVWPADGRHCVWHCPCTDPACAVPAQGGQELTTHMDNVVRALPRRKTTPSTRSTRRRATAGAGAGAGAEELPLW